MTTTSNTRVTFTHPATGETITRRVSTELFDQWNHRVRTGRCALCGLPSSDDFPCGHCSKHESPMLLRMVIAATRRTSDRILATRTNGLRRYHKTLAHA
jgi:hypothetical protein